MWFLDTQSELQLVNQRINETRREISGLRIGGKPRERRVRTWTDAAIVRLSSGAAQRQANRERGNVA